jgi:hypothetical protein
MELAAFYFSSDTDTALIIIVGVIICAAFAAVLASPEYGRIGTLSYGIAGGVVGLLATAWIPPVSEVISPNCGRHRVSSVG